MENDNVKKMLDSIYALEEKGYLNEAEKIFFSLHKLSSGNVEILLEKALFEFRNHMDLKALLDFCEVYDKTKSDEVKAFLIDSYYSPNKRVLAERYEANYLLIKQYPFFYAPDDVYYYKVFPLWHDENYCIWFDGEKDEIIIVNSNDYLPLLESEEAFIVESYMWEERIINAEELTRQKDLHMDMFNPFYLTWDMSGINAFLQLNDLEKILKLHRIVFLIDRNIISGFFMDYLSIIPKYIYPYNADFLDFMDAVAKKRRNEVETLIQDNKRYYSDNSEKVIEHIRNGNPKILFLTSRFTTALQYYTRDMASVAEKAGCKCRIIKEKNYLQRAAGDSHIEGIYLFRPDMVVVMDHMRCEYKGCMPDELVFVSWIQDLLPVIMDPSTPSKLLPRDILINQFYSYRGILDLYQGIDMIDASIPVNSDIYKPYDLTLDEQEMYGADITMVCHMKGSEHHIESIIPIYPELYRNQIEQIYRNYKEYVYCTGKILHGRKEYTDYILKMWSKQGEDNVEEIILNYMIEDMESIYGLFVFRESLVRWMLDAGFRNIKLWGNGWDNISMFKPYAMGPAPNGEILSKINQASKIVLGNNAICTAAARAGETMLSGGFYMVNYIDPESDWVDIRMQLEEGKDFVMFKDRDDLIQKLHFYLEHEDERKRMLEAERKAAQEHLTFEVFMKKFLREVPIILEKQETNTSHR